VSYSLTSPTGGQLTVDSSGVIRTGQANLPAGPIAVTALVTDNLGLTLPAFFTVTIARPITSLTFIPSVSPATTASPAGTVVGTLVTNDPNPNATMSYSLTSPTGGQLTVDSSGVIRTGQANLPAGPIAVTALVTDSLGLTQPATFTVNVTYGVLVLNQKTSVKAGSANPFQIELIGAAGMNVSSAGTTVTAIGIAPLSNPTALMYFPPGSTFAYNPQSGPNNPASYSFNLKTKGMGLSPGAYVLCFTVSGDPLVHTLEFTII
jgi:hypothetical protein